MSVPLQRAFAVLSWERAFPAFLPLFTAAAVIFALLWLGAYSALPLIWHLIALALSALTLMTLAGHGARKFRFPRRGETLRRIEERSDLTPGILDSVWAKPFAHEEDNPLWIASRERLLQSIGEPKVPLPRLKLREADPFMLRYVAVALVVLPLLLSRGDVIGLRASLTPPFPPQAPVIVDAWIEPPAYTGLSPRILKLQTESTAIGAATGTRLHLRIRHDDGTSVPGIITFQREGERRTRLRSEDDDRSQITIDLEQSGQLAIAARGESRFINLYVSPDGEPSVRVLNEPETDTGVIRFDVETEDDYPLGGGKMIVTLLPGQRISPDAPMVERSVSDEPEEFDLPSLAGPPGAQQVEVGSEEHPWAGLLVSAKIEVVDGLGQKAVSEPFAFTMPERTFYNPLSKVVIEERRKLAMAPRSLNRSADLFGAITEAPDLFDVEAAEHLMLKATAQAVAAATVRDVPDLIESLWPLAVELEDDGLTFARAQLEAAERALREALRNGASNEEIAQRIAELREAMNNYIAALAESGYGEADPSENRQQVGQNALDDLLSQMQDLAEEGSRSEAESLLAQLEALLQSLQLSRSNQGQQQGGEDGGQQGQQGQPGGQGQGGGSGGQGQQSLSGTGDLLQRQRELSDETFSARRGDRGSQGLGGEQQGLADALRDLIDGLPGEGEGARSAFEDAEQSMESAARALENGNLGLAQALQERALQQLREAGTELADALGEAGDDPSMGARDPLGRAFEGEGGPDPEDFGLYDPERIRALIEQIRGRLEDPGLSEAERDYLESLLERF